MSTDAVKEAARPDPPLEAAGPPENEEASKKRRVYFPEDDQLVTEFFEPANPWHDLPTTTREQLAIEYIDSCSRHNTPPIEGVLEQIKELPENTIGGATRASRLLLSSCLLIGSAAVDALEALLRKVQFRKLVVEHCAIDDEAAEALFDMAEYYESANSLVLTGPRDFNVRGWQAASRMIKKSAELSELEASDWQLEASHAAVLSRSLKPHTCRITSLCIQRAGLAGESLLSLIIALKSNCSVRELRLGDNALTGTDASQLAALLRTNARIHTLDLSNNNIQDIGVSHLADALVSQAAHTPPSPAASPLWCLEGYEQRGLAFLILWNNQLTRNCGPHLSRALRASSSLCVLNIGRNALGAELLNSLRPCPASLGLQGARLGPDAAKPLTALLLHARTLQRLDLRDNRLGSEGLQAVLAAMQDNTTLTQIDLDDYEEPKTLSADSSEEATCARLTKSILALCRRNEPNVTERAAHRKISLTCHTLAKPAPECGRRLRSPLPSPAPSPAGSPTPHQLPTNRFSVTRVTPERESSTESSSPSTPTRPSRFKVMQVAEPPQIQVQSAGTTPRRSSSSRFSVTRNYDAMYDPANNKRCLSDKAIAIHKASDNDKVTAIDKVIVIDKVTAIDKTCDIDKITAIDKARDNDKVTTIDKASDNDEVTAIGKASNNDKVTAIDKVIVIDKASYNDKVTAIHKNIDIDKASNNDKVTAIDKVIVIDKANDNDKVTTIDKASDNDKVTAIDKVIVIDKANDNDKVTTIDKASDNDEVTAIDKAGDNIVIDKVSDSEKVTVIDKVSDSDKVTQSDKAESDKVTLQSDIGLKILEPKVVAGDNCKVEVLSDIDRSDNDKKYTDKTEQITHNETLTSMGDENLVISETKLVKNTTEISTSEKLDMKIEVTVTKETVKDKTKGISEKVETGKENVAIKQIVAITEDLGILIKEMKDLSTKTSVLTKKSEEIKTVPVNINVVLKKNKSESSLDSPDLEVSRLMKKTEAFCDSSSSLEVSGSSMESLNTELDRRKVETKIDNANLLNTSMSSNESVSPLFDKKNESISSLEASVSSIDSKKMVTSADSGIEYSLRKEDDGTLTQNTALRVCNEETLTNSPKRTPSMLEVPKKAERQRKTSWVAPCSSFQFQKDVEKEPKITTNLEKLLSLFQNPSSIFMRYDDDKTRKQPSTPPRKESANLTSSFWSWGTQSTEKEEFEEGSTLSERVQVSFVDESFSKKLDSKTPSTDTDNTLSEFHSLPILGSESDVDDDITIRTTDKVQSLDLESNISKCDSTDLNDVIKNLCDVRPRSFAAVLKTYGSENSLKQTSPESADKLPSKVIRDIKENISPENTITSSTKTMALQLYEEARNPIACVWEENETKLEKDKKNISIDSGTTSLDETKLTLPLEPVDLGKDALAYLEDFEPHELETVVIQKPEVTLSDELRDAELKEMLDLSPELVMDDLNPEVFKEKCLRASPIIPVKLKKSNSLEALPGILEAKADSPKKRNIVFDLPETSTPRDIPRPRLRSRSGSSPKSLPESFKHSSLSKIDHPLNKKKKRVSSLGKIAKDSLLALNMTEDEIAEFRRSYKLTSVESLRSLESVSEDANSQSGNSEKCRCLRLSQESLMSLDSISEDCKCEKGGV